MDTWTLRYIDWSRVDIAASDQKKAGHKSWTQAGQMPDTNDKLDI